MNESAYKIVGIKAELVQSQPLKKAIFLKDKPIFSTLIFAMIVLGCIFAELIMTKDPTYMDLVNYTHAPNGEFIFGTDTLGRDIFSMIWYGGRLSLLMKYLSSGMWWLAFFPGLTLVCIVILFDRLGDNLKMLLDPYSAQE